MCIRDSYDVDGTAVDSRYNIDALQETCIELLGREATDEELKITYGMTAKNAILYLGAVSYTHLDVYKRQTVSITLPLTV